MAIAYQIPIANSIIATLISGEAYYSLNASLPLIDEKSVMGYCLNILMQWLIVIIIFMCHIGITSTQTFLILEVIKKFEIFPHKILIKLQVIPQVDIFEMKLKELAQKMGGKQNPLYEIIKIYCDYNYYVASIHDCVKLTLFFIVFINSVGIALSVVVLCKWSIITGCAVLFILISEVTIPCILGSIVEHQNERIVNAIYDFPFYDLDVADQKTFLQFLMFAQNSAKLSLPFFGTVNLELLKNVLNGGYSYFTYIKSFL